MVVEEQVCVIEMDNADHKSRLKNPHHEHQETLRDLETDAPKSEF